MFLKICGSYYRPQRSCGQGNVFTGVCLSTGGRVSASVHAGMPDPPDQAHPPETRHPPGTRQTTPPQTRQTPPPPGSRLQHTVYERPVRILLECILVMKLHVLFYVQKKVGVPQFNCLPFCGGDQ